MADNIDKINKEKLATLGKLYYDQYNNAYIGTRNGRLEKLKATTISNTALNSNSNLSLDWDLKKLNYDSSGNIILIEEYLNNQLVVRKILSYDSNENIAKITSSSSGKVTEKLFTYDSNNNIKSINIK